MKNWALICSFQVNEKWLVTYGQNKSYPDEDSLLVTIINDGFLWY